MIVIAGPAALKAVSMKTLFSLCVYIDKILHVERRVRSFSDDRTRFIYSNSNVSMVMLDVREPRCSQLA